VHAARRRLDHGVPWEVAVALFELGEGVVAVVARVEVHDDDPGHGAGEHGPVAAPPAACPFAQLLGAGRNLLVLLPGDEGALFGNGGGDDCPAGLLVGDGRL
jgi:hypothetical protein